jgi:lipoyl(octanoyl) transferase
VTSLVDLGLPVSMADLDVALRAAFERRFAPPGTGRGPACGEPDAGARAAG